MAKNFDFGSKNITLKCNHILHKVEYIVTNHSILDNRNQPGSWGLYLQMTSLRRSLRCQVLSEVELWATEQ